MRKLLLTLTVCAGMLTAQAQGVYQIPNSDFESWAANNEPGNGWNSFASAEGKLSQAASMSPSPKKVEGYNGGNAVQLTSKYAGWGPFGANANGNLTTGRIYMGSMTPKDPANYNFTDLDDEAHSFLFAGKPDSVACYAKFVSGGSANGRGQFILHDKYEYRDPEVDGDEAHKIALAAILIPECKEWTRFSAPFEYTDTEADEQYMLASFTTNPVPGGSANDTLIVDSVQLIYNSELASLTYDGQDIFVAGQAAYDLSGKAFDESKLACTSNGHAATIEKGYNETTGVLTITVKGDDWSETNKNEHDYTIQFKVKAPEVANYTNDLLIALVMDGVPEYTPPTSQTIQLIKELDGTYSFFLENFTFAGTIPVGDIKMTNLNRTEEGGKVVYEQTQELTLLIVGTVTVGLHAEEMDGQLTATIHIPDAMAEMGMSGVNVDVTFAPSLVVNGGNSIGNDLNGLYNVTINRTFPKGWSTICLPFATTVEALGAEQAQEFTAFAGNTLTFEKVADGNLVANKPYLIYFESEKDLSAENKAIYMPVEIAHSTPEAVSFGGMTFTGNYTAGMSMKGLYGVADQDGSQYIMQGGEGSTLGSTSVYFTWAGSAQANVMRIHLDGGETGINSVDVEAAEAFDVYTLSGVKVRSNVTDLGGLQRGIYIINGKKVLVK